MGFDLGEDLSDSCFSTMPTLSPDRAPQRSTESEAQACVTCPSPSISRLSPLLGGRVSQDVSPRTTTALTWLLLEVPVLSSDGEGALDFHCRRIESNETSVSVLSVKITVKDLAHLAIACLCVRVPENPWFT